MNLSAPSLHHALKKYIPFFNLSVGSPGGSVVKNLPANAGDPDLIPELGRSPGEGNGNPLPFLPGESHVQWSLAGYSPWGCGVRPDLVTKQQQILRVD